jgi:hypothetical protein
VKVVTVHGATPVASAPGDAIGNVIVNAMGDDIDDGFDPALYYHEVEHTHTHSYTHTHMHARTQIIAHTPNRW